jgi:L-alanine-DL-glutamate epimerase-like enolase superfamily enzyme
VVRGTSESIKICTLASIFDVPVIPHGHSLHAALHVIASQSPAVCPLAEYLIVKMQSYYHFEKTPPAPKDAHFALPEGPGYGIELDESKVEARELLRWA